jgi:putative ABC transport system permease protein
MLKNYLKTAIRQLWRNKFYSLLNIMGLAIGLSSCLLIVLYVRDEVSYDQFHKNKDRIYRISEEFKTGETTMETGLTPYKLAPDLKRRFPEIQDIVRLDFDLTKYIVKSGDRKFIEESITSADSTFFSFFSFPLLEGNPKTVLNEPYTVAISDVQAKKYFAYGDAMGKILEFIDPGSYKSFQAKITGVFRAMPDNSHFHKDFIFSKATADLLIPDRIEELGWTSHFSYLLLAPGTEPKKLEKAINEYIFKNYPQDVLSWWKEFHLQSIKDIHLKSNLKEEFEPNSDISYVYVFSAIAIFLILLAAINYMNLATARAANRAREVGVRKVIGASKKQLVYQFLGESIIITGLALIVAAIITTMALPFFNTLSGKNIALNFIDLKLFTIVILITFLIGVFSGSYPALFLSAFQPVKVLKGTMARAGTRSLLIRRGLVVLQFSISIALITGTIIIYTQWRYLQNKKLGINSEQVVVIPTETDKLKNQYDVLKSELLRQPGITDVTASRKSLTSRFGNYTSIFADGKEQVRTIPWTFVDINFFRTFNIPIVSGSDFPMQYKEDSLVDFILNESAAKLLGISSPIGLTIESLGRKGRIKGIVKDFHFESLHNMISPVIFTTNPGSLNFFAIKIKSDDYRKTIGAAEQVFKKIDPEAIFNYSFLNDDINKLYKTEAKFFNVFTAFSCLAVFIACLGILGLAAFTASQKSKEIGIRRVLGASVHNISLLLTKEFIKLVIVANLVAWPVAYLVMYRWLQDFPYRIQPAMWMFLVAAGFALLLAILTAGFHAIKAAVANPVKSLRTE